MNSPNDDPNRLRLNILSANDLYNINEEVTGHTPFVRDHQVLRSAVRRPYLIIFGEEQFPTVIDKAAATMHSLAAHHVFADGNKRTAERATRLFLEANDIQPAWTHNEVQAFLLRIARHEVTLDEVTAWLHTHTTDAASD